MRGCKIKNYIYTHTHILKPILVFYTSKSNSDSKHPNDIFHTNHFCFEGIQTLITLHSTYF